VIGLQQVVSGGAVEPLVAQAQSLSLVDGAPGPLPHAGFDPGMVFGQHRELVGERFNIERDGSPEAIGNSEA
jgi:hypothetical protein